MFRLKYIVDVNFQFFSCILYFPLDDSDCDVIASSTNEKHI